MPRTSRFVGTAAQRPMRKFHDGNYISQKSPGTPNMCKILFDFDFRLSTSTSMDSADRISNLSVSSKARGDFQRARSMRDPVKEEKKSPQK